MEPKLKITQKMDGIEMQGGCTACPTVLFTSGNVVIGDRESNRRELERLFEVHRHEKHGS